MKLKFYLALSVILLNSCSKIYQTDTIVKDNYKRSFNGFTYTLKDNYYITNKIPCYTKSKQLLIDSLSRQMFNYLRSNYKHSKSETETYNSIKSQLNDTSFTKFDTSKQIIISFSEDIKNIQYNVVAINHWDHTNTRILFPFLLLGNRKHLQNQCLNRAVQACIQIDADGAIINSDLKNAKLFMVK